MARDIFQIQDDIITFIGDKGEQVSGSSADCRIVGGKFISDGSGGGVCVLKNTKNSNANLTNNRNILGQANTVHTQALNNNIIGDYNTVGNVENTHTIGKFAKTIRHGEFTKSNSTALGRSQKSVLFYEGTTNASKDPTELFLMGVTNKRLFVDETFSHSAIALDIHTIIKYDDAGVAAAGYLHSKALFSSIDGTLAQLGTHETLYDQLITTANLTLSAESGTPDYIKFVVAGDRRSSIAWSIIVNVYEIRKNAV